MSDTTSSLRRKIGSIDEYQSVVRTMKTFAAPSIGQNTSRFQAEFSGKLLSAMRFEFGGHIEKSAGKHRRKSRDLLVLRERVPVQRSAHRCYKLVLRAVLLGSVCSVLISAAMAQEPVGKAGEPQKLTSPAKEKLSPAPAKVDVNPVARDEEIRKRLQNVLDATDWFIDPQVRVEEGVVFVNGQVESDELKKWAGDLARNTQDVVAVASRKANADAKARFHN